MLNRAEYRISNSSSRLSKEQLLLIAVVVSAKRDRNKKRVEEWLNGASAPFNAEQVAEWLNIDRQVLRNAIYKNVRPSGRGPAARIDINSRRLSALSDLQTFKRRSTHVEEKPWRTLLPPQAVSDAVATASKIVFARIKRK